LIMSELVQLKTADEKDIPRFAPPASFLKQVHNFLHSQPTAAPLVVFLTAIMIFSILVGKRFFHPFNLSLVLQQVTIISILGIAQTLIILTAGIDLSVGAIMVLSSVLMGRMAVDFGVPAFLAIAMGIGLGFLAGAINGVLVARFKLPPLIVTLGTWSIFWALNLWYSGSQTIRSQDLDAGAPFLKWTGTSFNFWGARLTYGSIIMILVFAVIWYALNHTAWGKHVYATGDNPETAQLVGIATGRVLFSVYALSGVICAIGAWVLIGRLGSVTPIAGQTANMDSITAVVIGGTSLFGGRGSIVGTLIGALIVGVFRNGLALAGVDVLWQEFTVGLLMIIAVAIDQWIRKVSS
jgi:fructose transport system permease protein